MIGFSISKKSLQAKLLVIFTACLLVLFALNQVVIYFLTSKTYFKIYNERLPRMKEMSEFFFAEKLSKLSRYSTQIDEDPNIGRALLTGDREALKMVLIPIYEKLKNQDKDVNTVEVTNDKGIIVLRAHNPDFYGDDKSKTQIFGEVLNTKKPKANIDVSTSTGLLSLDAVAPIFFENRFAGLVKVGIYPKSENLLELKKLLDADVAVLMKKDKDIDDSIKKKYQVDARYYQNQKLLVYGSTLSHDDVDKFMSFNGKEARDLKSGKNSFIAKEFSLKVLGNEVKDFSLLIAVPKLEQQMIKSSLVTSSLIAGVLAFILIAAIGFALKRMIINPIIRITKDLNQHSSSLNEYAEELSSSSRSLSKGATDQASALEEMSASLEEISSMAKQNASNAIDADKLMQEIKLIVDNFKKEIRKLTTNMSDINEASDKIADVIKIIDKIAFQTNLLALNAAVEAARAGDAGVGFAVVADEVRKLAMNAAESAKSISETIEAMIEKAKNGKMFVEEINANFSHMSDKLGNAVELVNQISTASNEQAQGIAQLREAVIQIDLTTQEVAAKSEELAAIAEQTRHQSIGISTIVKDLDIIAIGED
ncbi:MAG: methyl-accepting chemotaxis protein [Thermodesulforhabdaceae bacterium]